MTYISEPARAETNSSNDGDSRPVDDGPVRWNYRVLHRTVETGVPGMEPVDEWVLIEAHYDKDGRIVAWCEAGPMASDVSLQDLRDEAVMREQAVQRSMLTSPRWRVLTEADLPADSGGSEPS